MTPEQTFNTWLRGCFNERDEDYHRVENSAGNGMPDINICKSGFEVWVESKVIYRDKAILRKEQYAWGMRRAVCGGTVFVLARDDYYNTIHAYQFPSLVCKPRGDNKTMWIEYTSVVRKIDFTLNPKAELKKLLFPSL